MIAPAYNAYHEADRHTHEVNGILKATVAIKMIMGGGKSPEDKTEEREKRRVGVDKRSCDSGRKVLSESQLGCKGQ
jgi:hypothetical protein